MAKKAININGTATQMVGDINDNFDELYEGAGAGSLTKDHKETYTAETAIYSSGKVMGSSEGKLVFTDASSSRKIFCIDIDTNDDSVAYQIPAVQANNGALSYAFVDDENNIIASSALGTGTTDASVFVSLANVKKVYISRPSSADSASLKVYVFGDYLYDELFVEANMSTSLVALGSRVPAISESGYFSPSSNSLAKTIIIPITGCKTIEGVGKVRQDTLNWVILDKDLKVLKSHTYSSVYYSRTAYQHIPDGARFLACQTDSGDTDTALVADYTLRTKLPKVEYNILALGNSFTQCYWTYVPAILEHLLGDDYKITIFYGMLGASTFENWKNWLVGTGTQSIGITINNTWYSYYALSAQSVFNMIDVDLIGFQQQSNQSMMYYTWRDMWIAAVKAGSQRAKNQIDFMWTMVHSKPTTTEVADSDATMQSIMAANKAMEEDFAIDICPVGTAIQNARHTSINDLPWEGDYGQLTPEGTHLQKGFACFIAGWVVARYICKKLGIDVPCYGDKMNIDAEFDATYRNLTGYGTNPVYATDMDMVYLAQRCVEAALKFPYEIKTNLGTT